MWLMLCSLKTSLGSWIFDSSSLVDFLAFCFALNTMFTFDKFRHQLLWHLTKGVSKIVEENQVAITAIKDSEATLSKAPETVKELAKEIFDLKDYVGEIDSLKSKYKNKFTFFSKLFQKVFMAFAIISAILLIFSKWPFFYKHYKYSVFLLAPCLLLYVVSLYYHLRIWWDLKCKGKEIKGYGIHAQKLNKLMNNMNSLIVANRQKS